MQLPQWVRLPSAWINQGGLKELRWGINGQGSDNTAALMALVVIAHAADPDSGISRVTYDDLCGLTGLSRAKFSSGLDVLTNLRIIERTPEGRRSTYKLTNYSRESGWAKLPALSMYSAHKTIAAFEDFRLRSPAELNAFRLFFLFVARRSEATNMAHLSYDKIHDYSVIERSQIKTAISFLASLLLVYVEHFPSGINELGTANGYRIVGINSRAHRGTSTGRSANQQIR